jgi:hypothetical protein
MIKLDITRIITLPSYSFRLSTLILKVIHNCHTTVNIQQSNLSKELELPIIRLHALWLLCVDLKILKLCVVMLINFGYF